MPDREEVVKGIQECDLNGGLIGNCPYKGILLLLKEQEQQIWELQDQVEYLTDKQKEQKFLVDSDGKITPLPEIVRCKDCTYYLPLVHSCQHLPATVANPNGFCSDGKRREESDE